ncbi:hypothetical protein LSM04_003993 [Trypanosoma melophagium]|uniref:uncharacterized protein n=1 Tax=Trypanosoma melophagium TaxID=715481 RepID=UPI00351A23D9|nr:hypothetical protein LSM04_003993 [Trypanosoma melophagium]
MLIQLRRVVYLLVLLQCCLGVSVASAGETKNPGTDAGFASASSALRESINCAEELIAKGTASKKASDEMDVAVRRVENKARYDRKNEEVKGKLEEPKGMVKGESSVTEATTAVLEAITSIAWADYLHDNCRNLSESMKIEERQLGDLYLGFKDFFLTGWRRRRK